MSAEAFLHGDDTLRLTPFRPKALYLSFYGIGSQAIREAALKVIRDAALNAMVIDVKGDRGLIAYHSTIPLARAVGAQRIITIPDLPTLLEPLHRKGLYTIARIVTFKDDPLAAARPDLAIKLANGKLFRDREGLGWTDPSLAEVRDYDISIAVEAARAGFDEIQFDYLRFPDAPAGVGFAKPTTQAGRLQSIAGFLAEAHRGGPVVLFSTAHRNIMTMSWHMVVEFDKGRNCCGRDIDKFAVSGPTPPSAGHVTSSFVKKCVANLECRIVDTTLREQVQSVRTGGGEGMD